jgi:hypothetical protein
MTLLDNDCGFYGLLIGEGISNPSAALRQGLINAGVNSLAGFTAGKIGAAYGDGDIDPITHKIFHTAVGAGTGEILHGNALSEAFGAAVVKTLAEQLIAEAPQAIDNLAFDNPSLSNKELMDLYKKVSRALSI